MKTRRQNKTGLFKRKIIYVVGFIVIIAAIFAYFILKNNYSADTNMPSQTSVNSTPSQSETVSESTVAISSAPILMYHYIRVVTDPNDTIGANLSVSPSNFESQIKYLHDNNYESISLSGMASGFAGDKIIKAGKKPVVITFDDGYDDAYTQAYPILKKYNMVGIFYIITGQVGQSERMTKAQIIDLDKNGMIVGSHTKNHLDLTGLSSAQLITQLSDSKAYLEQLLGHTVDDFCYPAGEYDRADILELKKENYKTAVTTHSGIADTKSDLFELSRIRVQNDTNLSKVLGN